MLTQSCDSCGTSVPIEYIHPISRASTRKMCLVCHWKSKKTGAFALDLNTPSYEELAEGLKHATELAAGHIDKRKVTTPCMKCKVMGVDNWFTNDGTPAKLERARAEGWGTGFITQYLTKLIALCAPCYGKIIAQRDADLALHDGADPKRVAEKYRHKAIMAKTKLEKNRYWSLHTQFLELATKADRTARWAKEDAESKRAQDALYEDLPSTDEGELQ